MHDGELGRYRVRRTPSTSDADIRPRPTKCARLSRHAKVVAMLLLSPENGFREASEQGVVQGVIFMLHSNVLSQKYFPFVRLQAEA